MDKHTGCLLCDSKRLFKLEPYYAKHQLVKCSDCGFVFMERIPTQADLDRIYGQYSYASEGYLSPLTVQSYNKLLDEMEPYRRTGKLLDVGCGRRWFLAEARKRGWRVYGTEYSPEAVLRCREQGVEARQGSLADAGFDEGMFDVITSFEVIEHVNTPLAEARLIHKLLRSGGLFYLTTPNFNAYLRFRLKENFNVITYPEHLCYFARPTLRRLARRAGFKPLRILTTGVSVTRLRASRKPGSDSVATPTSSDEQLRARVARRGYLRLAKVVANRLLSLFGVGMTLKGYFTKD